MKAWQFAKKYPEIHKGIILKISKANGFSPSEIREYRKALRELPKQNLGTFIDADRVISIVVFSDTSQGTDFWWSLETRLGDRSLV